MIEFLDFNDSDGYRATFVSWDAAELEAVAEWLDQHGIGHDFAARTYFDTDGEPSDEITESIMTDWITNTSLAVLVKMRWGGSQ